MMRADKGRKAVEIWKGSAEAWCGGWWAADIQSPWQQFDLSLSLSAAVRSAVHTVTEWTGCADDQRWGGGGSILGSEAAVGASLLRRALPPLSSQLCHLQTPRAALIGLAVN